MTRAADLTAVVVVSTRHCNDFDCDKCRARYRWLRRKSWRSPSPRTVPPATGRGDAR